MTNFTAIRAGAYGWLLLAGIAVSLAFWIRLARKDPRLIIIYLSGLAGAFFGAKVVFVFAEGFGYWNHPDRWTILATGKSVLGALLGGYAGVEIAKQFVAYRTPTGDLFGIVTPMGLVFGRAGCWANGCCLGRPHAPAWFTVPDPAGIPRWPAVQLELLFQILALLVLLWFRSRGWLRNQLFHLYLMAYGLFRFVCEPWRATPKFFGDWSGYQLAALLVFTLGAIGFWRRARSDMPRQAPL